jgi:hypothetical protein
VVFWGLWGTGILYLYGGTVCIDNQRARFYGLYGSCRDSICIDQGWDGCKIRAVFELACFLLVILAFDIFVESGDLSTILARGRRRSNSLRFRLLEQICSTILAGKAKTMPKDRKPGLTRFSAVF